MFDLRAILGIAVVAVATSAATSAASAIDALDAASNMQWMTAGNEADLDAVEPAASASDVRLRFPSSYVPTVMTERDSPAPGALKNAAAPPRFGQAGSMRFNVHAGGGVDVKTSRNKFGMAGLGLSYFMIDDVSVEFELNALAFDQEGEGAFAPNFALLLRWHILNEDKWSFFIDGGAGMLYASRRVPFDGSRFNFTPQAGAGITREITPTVRAVVGMRWHHVSNARTSRSNPGRDHVMAYVGLSMPF